MLQLDTTLVDCRTAVVPVCEPERSVDAQGTVSALGLFQHRLRDVLDYTVDFSAWIAANGGTQLDGVAWAVAADSPKTPVLSDDSFAPSGKAVVLVTPGAGATVGDTYYIEATATFAARAASADLPALPARTLVKRIHIIVVKG